MFQTNYAAGDKWAGENEKQSLGLGAKNEFSMMCREFEKLFVHQLDYRFNQIFLNLQLASEKLPLNVIVNIFELASWRGCKYFKLS